MLETRHEAGSLITVERNQSPMKKIVHYIGLDVHIKPTEDNQGNEGESEKRNQVSDTISTNFHRFLNRMFRAAKRNQDGVRVLRLEREKKLFPRRIFVS